SGAVELHDTLSCECDAIRYGERLSDCIGAGAHQYSAPGAFLRERCEQLGGSRDDDGFLIRDALPCCVTDRAHERRCGGRCISTTHEGGSKERSCEQQANGRSTRLATAVGQSVSHRAYSPLWKVRPVYRISGSKWLNDRSTAGILKRLAPTKNSGEGAGSIPRFSRAKS